MVLDAVGSEQAALLGVTAGGLISILFAATYPDRVRALVLYGAFARQLRDDHDYPIGLRPEDVDAHVAYTEARWGTGVGLRLYCPSASDDPVARDQLGRFQRGVGQPGRRDLLPPGAGPDRRAPRPTDGRRADARPARQAGPCHLRSSTPGTWPSGCRDATLVELDSADHLIWFSDALDVMTDEIQDFLIAAVPNRDVRRVLATVVFIDELGPRPQALSARAPNRGRAS